MDTKEISAEDALVLASRQEDPLAAIRVRNAIGPQVVFALTLQ